ncbi:universal stress protein [Roseateles oligotrophus]|uniref:Universal stress protein n=1 Tax=Roseateles oligotrophus TaxID=1769250 RepID=A0ABT2YEJ3_9BURK|nr:universal stress protein [Roseateles oligotrophus]MCV2368446.1 universal stress protein [Roseateles oligotrophus]
MFKKILLPTDGSETARRAALVAADMAGRYGAALEIVSVIDPLPFVYFPDGSTEAMALYLEAAESAAKLGLVAAEAAAKAAGVACVSHILREHGPAQAITEHALSSGCDLIVMGSHGRRGLDAVILGSVAQKVLTLAKVPVLVVK